MPAAAAGWRASHTRQGDWPASWWLLLLAFLHCTATVTATTIPTALATATATATLLPLLLLSVLTLIDMCVVLALYSVPKQAGGKWQRFPACPSAHIFVHPPACLSTCLPQTYLPA